eukprot:scaffold22779_cov67-Phaeocystis_antarctica.AAC.4
MEDRRVEVLVDVELPSFQWSVQGGRASGSGQGMGVAIGWGWGVTWSNSGVSSLTPFSSRVFVMSRTRPTCFESVRFHVYDCACALNA